MITGKSKKDKMETKMRYFILDKESRIVGRISAYLCGYWTVHVERLGLFQPALNADFPDYASAEVWVLKRRPKLTFVLSAS